MKKNFFDYLFICHKLPNRSFFYKGKQFPICARCTGIFIGYILALIHLVIYIFIPSLSYPNFIITFLLFIPTLLDGGIQYFTSYESTNYRRLITGIIAGIATIYLFTNIAHLAMLNAEWLVRQIKK